MSSQLPAEKDAYLSAPPLIERVLKPFAQFAHMASSGGIVLLLCTAVALAWANSPWAGQPWAYSLIGVALWVAVLASGVHATNAGVPLSGGDHGAVLSSPVTLGVLLGLVLGKPLGILLFSWAAVRAGLAALPRGVTWSLIHGVSWLGGIGFTMSLFVAGLAFTEGPALLTQAKLGVLMASLAAGLCGGFLLWRGGRRET